MSQADDLDPRELGRTMSAPLGVQDDVQESGAGELGDEHDRANARVRYRMTGGGHAYVTDTDPHSATERPVYIHRLAAVAWGVLDGLDDPRHVHHDLSEWAGADAPETAGVPWLTAETVLEAELPTDHARHHFGGDR
jgi:hypothetical protein